MNHPDSGAAGIGKGQPGSGSADQLVTGTVVLGDVIQIREVGGNVSVTLSRPVYRVEGFPRVRTGLTAAQARAQPSRLLLARYELVPFAGRTGLVAELSGWLTAVEPTSVRLVYGPGGQGKSRLAAEFARHHTEGWAVWQARQASPTSQSPARIKFPAGAMGLLVVVDYADRWAPSHLQALIADVRALVSRLPDPLPLRVLLLARTAGFWWDALEQRLDAEDGMPGRGDAAPATGRRDRPGRAVHRGIRPFRGGDGHYGSRSGRHCATARAGRA